MPILIPEAEGRPDLWALNEECRSVGGRPWFIIKAKVWDITEDGNLTMARIAMDAQEKEPAVRCRAFFLTNFQEGDVVDVIGFMAGSTPTKARQVRA